MKAHHFIGQTHVLEAPREHDHQADGEIYGLPVKQLTHADGRHWGWESVWKPSPEQLATLNAGGGCVVRWAGGQPPMDVDTCAPELLTDVPA